MILCLLPEKLTRKILAVIYRIIIRRKLGEFVTKNRKQVSIFGGGFVGRTLHQYLQEKTGVHLLSERSSDSAVINISYSGPFDSSIQETLENSDLIFLATGSGSLDWAEAFPDEARALHFGQVENILRQLGRLSKRVVYISTDKVFSGLPVIAGSHQVATFKFNDRPNPDTTYGQLKKMAEDIVLQTGGSVVRVPLLVSMTPSHRNPLFYALEQLRGSGPYDEDDTQLRFPTFIEDIGDYFLEPRKDIPKIMHFSAPKMYTRFSILKLIAERIGASVTITNEGVYPPVVKGQIRAKRSQIQLVSNVNTSFRSVVDFIYSEEFVKKLTP